MPKKVNKLRVAENRVEELTQENAKLREYIKELAGSIRGYVFATEDSMRLKDENAEAIKRRAGIMATRYNAMEEAAKKVYIVLGPEEMYLDMLEGRLVDA